MWAQVAGGLKAAMTDREEARVLSNASREPVFTEWQRWLLDHVDDTVTQARAIELAVMWARVAQVQPSDGT